MKTTPVVSYEDLKTKIGQKEHAYLILYKEGSALSNCALEHIREASSDQKDFELYTVNVNEVRDIHSHFSVTSAPTLLSFEKGSLVNTFKGCNDKIYYKAVFENLVYQSASGGEEKPVKRVTVYSTPTCSWCNTLKSYLRKNGIRFRDIDVSRDQKAAEDLVRRTGQQGVPQTDINGQVIVGFNKERINELLGIQG